MYSFSIQPLCQNRKMLTNITAPNKTRKAASGAASVFWIRYLSKAWIMSISVSVYIIYLYIEGLHHIYLHQYHVLLQFIISLQHQTIVSAYLF